MGMSKSIDGACRQSAVASTKDRVLQTGAFKYTSNVSTNPERLFAPTAYSNVNPGEASERVILVVNVVVPWYLFIGY